jgi:hypothetical protein
MSDNSLSRNDIDQSLTDSDLTYLAKNSSSLVIERTSKRSYADNPEYGTGNTNLVVNFQTGVDYVDGRNSYLKLTLEPNKLTNTAMTWGNGSVLNLIDTVTVKSRSGTVLGRTERVNLLQYYETKYKNSWSYFGDGVSGATSQGVGMGGGLLGYSRNAITLPASIEYNIPLHFIHSFFDQENLLPSMVMKGLRLEITLADASTAFKVSGGVAIAPTYVVRNVWASLDSYRLTDDAMRKLNDMSREAEGLVLQYHDYEQSRFTRPIGVNNVSTEVRKTVSMANEAFLVTRIETNINDKLKDSFLAQGLTDGDRYQWRVGSMYIPQTELQGKAAWYANMCYCKGQLKSREQPFVRYSHSDPAVPTFTSTDGNAGGGFAISCVDLNRYWLDLSGLAINNSVTLNANMEYSNATVAGELDLFLKHTRRLAVYNDNIIVLE